VILASLLLGMAGCASPEPAATSGSSPSFTLAYQGAVDGEIEPCG